MLFVSLQTGAGAAKFVLFVVGMALLSLGLVSAAGSQAIERRARGVRPYWGPSPILLFLACIPTAALPLILLGVPLQLAGVDIDGPPVAVLALLVQAAVYVLLIRLVVVDTGALSWSEMRIRRPSVASFGELGYGAVWALPIIFVTGLISFVLVSAFGVTPDSPLPPASDPAGLVLNLIAGAILAPIGEELFFRGFATTAWVKGLGVTRGDRPRRFVLCVHPRPADPGEQRDRRAGGRVHRVRGTRSHRSHARLAVHQARHDLGADRPPRGVQRDPRAHRGNGLASAGAVAGASARPSRRVDGRCSR